MVKEIKIKIYEYDELSEDAKIKAFEDHAYFIECNPQEYEDNEGNIKRDDYSKWSEQEFKEYVEENIRINEYLFFANGEQAHATTYTKTNKTILKLFGEEYEV